MNLFLLFIVSKSVTIGSVQHLFPIGFAVLFTILLIKYSKRQVSQRQKQNIIHYLGCFVSITVICFHLYRILYDNYNFKTDLPLYLCSLLAVIIPVFTYFRKYWMFEILVFWIIGGTLQGVITPDISGGFPSLDYLRYWVVHLGLLAIIFYFILVFNMKPKLRSVVKSFIALQVYVVIMMVLNYVLDANYFYLNEKPISSTLLDYFGEWPYYLLIGELVIIPLFLIIYFPFYLIERHKKLFGK